MKSFKNWFKIKEFNKKLSSFQWGPVGEKLDILKKNDFKNYRTISPKIFYELKIGTCWDYVEAQRSWYKDQNIEHKVYYAEANNKEKATHTFLIAKINNKFLWDESSWKSEQGLHYDNSEKELINRICKKQIKTIKNANEINVYVYPKPNKFNMTVEQFMEWVKKNGKHILTWSSAKSN